jgi:hypothetical protein
MHKANEGRGSRDGNLDLTFESTPFPVHFNEYIKEGGDGAIFHVGMSVVILI